MKIDAIVWQAGKDLQDMEGLKQHIIPLQDDTAGTLASPPALLGNIWNAYAGNIQAAITAIQNRCDTDAARWLLSNVGNWLSSTMEGNGAAHWLRTYKKQVLRAYKDAKAGGNPVAVKTWAKELVTTQTAETALGTLCALLRGLQAWTALQSTYNPPQEEGAQLSTIKGTQREEDYYRRAIERGYMERHRDGYRWKHDKVCWGYFMQLCYKPSDLQKSEFRAQAERLFDIQRLDRHLGNITKVAKPQPWRGQMDKDFVDLEPYAIK